MNESPGQAEHDRRARGVEAPMWRSLDELARTPAFEDLRRREFPEGAGEWTDEISRRECLRVMGASLALAGLHGCTERPRETIVPYVYPPERVVPGKPLYFATAMEMGGYGTGVVVESQMGRPIKMEGNPRHPASLGATSSFGQSSVLMLYDPDRSKVVLQRSNVSDWGAFLTRLGPVLEAQRATRGAGLRLLTETVTSPTLADQIHRLLQAFPEARWHQWDPVSRENLLEGARLALGRSLNPIYHFGKARIIVALDADFLFEGPGSLRYAREFIDGRRVATGPKEMNRLYVAEPTPTLTGSMADHRLAVRSAEIEDLARALAGALEVPGIPPLAQALTPERAKWVSAVAADLRAHAGHGLVLAGEWQPPVVHALAWAMNVALGNVEPVTFTEPVEAHPVAPRASLRELVEAMTAGRVEALMILGGNPAYTAPADIPFAEALLKLSTEVDAQGASRRFTAHLGLYPNETAFRCQWHIPQAHFLESWGDVRAYNGLVSVVQPLIAPLYGGRTAHELLAALMNEGPASTYEIVRARWRQQHQGDDFEAQWRSWLEQGLIPGTELPPQPAGVRRDLAWPPPRRRTSEALELVFRPDPTVRDGSFANVAWQQELPKPFTKLTWDNAALLGPETARRLGVRNQDMVWLQYRGRSLRAAAWILPGQVDGAVALHLGYGGDRPGQAGPGPGFNAYTLRTADAPWFGDGLEIEKTGEQYPLAVTSFFHTIESRAIGDVIRPEVVQRAGQDPAREEPDRNNRNLVRVGTLETFIRQPHFVQEMEGEAARRPLLSLYPEYPYTGYKWGMSIDLSACIGCNACVVACQAENNIPVVGKTETARGRAMHWLRIDDYFKGPPEDPEMYHLPVPCMHCEKAPCEVVCPVNATVHDSEGLNEMVYNRCVGTRYCSNNCPYKVRRFNFLDFAGRERGRKMQRNPNVTVRGRGVMEKCTYCIQRISAARIEAEKENRRIRADEFTTACAQACPTRAIVFGDLNEPAAEVTKRKASPLDYGLLTELTTQPRTTYLARIRNPNPALEVESQT